MVPLDETTGGTMAEHTSMQPDPTSCVRATWWPGSRVVFVLITRRYAQLIAAADNSMENTSDVSTYRSH